MSRLLIALLAALVAAGSAFAQAPAVEPATKLSFAPTLGGATLSRSTSAGGGSTYQYSTPNGMEITIDVYGERVPNGSSHPTIINRFNDELGVIRQQAAAAGMTGFEKPAVPSTCTYGQYNFRCITFSVAGGPTTGRIFGKFLLIGYRERFVKIIIQWPQRGGQTGTDADKVLNGFVPALMR
jgi:hypothetical protein